MTNKIIVNFTPTGLIPKKTDSPFVPIQIKEIIEDVKKAYDQGITMVHLHARDENELPTYDKEIYAKIIRGIRSFSKDLIICVSTSGRIFTEYSQRSDVLQLMNDLKPDMASLTLGSINFNRIESINSPQMIEMLAKEMLNKNIKPEIEIFDLGMVNYMKYLINKDLLKPPYYVNIIVGNIASMQLDLLHIGQVLKDLPDECYVSIGGVGNYQFSANSLAISQGLGVRVGLEDNYWYDQNRTIKATNEMLLNRIHNVIKSNQCEIMTSQELREKLSLK